MLQTGQRKDRSIGIHFYVLERLKIYRDQTEPLVKFYKDLAASTTRSLKLYAIDGQGDTSDIKVKISDIT